MKQQPQLPLTGVRVVDFGQQIAAPAVAMTLADLGATVVRIDPPGGPQWQHPANAVLQRNKQCLELDLKDPSAVAKALELVALADIVIEGFRPGVMQRLGIDFAKLRQLRPELITLSIPGFASNDQLRRDWKATEAVIAATSGAFTDMGFNRVLMGVNPSFSPLPLGSSYAISLAASSVVFALLEREKSGRGDAIEVPIAAALMEGLSYNSYVIENMPERYITMREQEISRRREQQLPMDVSYQDLQEYLDPFFRSYLCADGRMFYCVCPSHRNHARRCLEVLGIYQELLDEGLPEVGDLYRPIAQWDGETSIGVYPLPEHWAKRIAAKMKRAFLLKSSEQWGRIFGAKQIPGAPHRTTQEWVNSEHTNQAGLIVPLTDPELGPMKQPGPIAWFEGAAQGMLKPKPRQQVSFHEARQLLANLAESEQLTRPTGADISAPSGKGWLDGLKVLDLTNVIAGPHCCAYLTRFGAQVTKLDPITPLYDPLIGTVYAFLAGNGKDSALVDINTPEGREIFNALVKSVDLVVMNAPQRQVEQLGIDHESLKAINPEVLFCRLDCLGGPNWGAKSNYIGYDDIIQAISGIMTRFGGEQTPEEHAHVGTLDVNCGFAAGLGIGAALYHRLKTGEVHCARTSLSAVTNMAQLPFALDYPGFSASIEPSGREAMGNHALSRFYQTQDGWLFIDATVEQLAILDSIEPLIGVAKAEDKQQFLEAAFAGRDSKFWQACLMAYDIAVAIPQSIEQLRDNYSRIADGRVGIDRGSYAFSIYPDHPSGHQVTQIDHYAIRPTEAAIKAVAPTQKFGHSTVAVLERLGYSAEQIDQLLAKNIVGLSWAEEYLPS